MTKRNKIQRAASNLRTTSSSNGARILGARGNEVKAARREFVNRFGTSALEALTVIRKLDEGKAVSYSKLVAFSTRTLGSFRANLTRGVYADFIRVNNKGTVVKDRLNVLSRV